MKIERTSADGFEIVKISGNIVLEETSTLKRHVEPLIEKTDLQGLILNCEEVKFIDSSGLGLIVSIYKTLKKVDKTFALTSLNDKAMEIFVLTKLDKILTIAADDESALKILK